MVEYASTDLRIGAVPGVANDPEVWPRSKISLILQVGKWTLGVILR